MVKTEGVSNHQLGFWNAEKDITAFDEPPEAGEEVGRFFQP